jgi:hypothetical protein
VWLCQKGLEGWGVPINLKLYAAAAVGPGPPGKAVRMLLLAAWGEPSRGFVDGSPQRICGNAVSGYGPATGVGVKRLVVVPSPSWPEPFKPQQ